MDWKPIETCPPEDVVVLGWWVDMPDVGKWWEVIIDCLHEGPTHWMSLDELPPPPAFQPKALAA